jgi:tripartite-type tricarboxylate transporter receptor subunit TctC
VKHPIRILIAAGALALTAAPALAQNYPTRPIRVITATSAGGTSDIFMRVAGEAMHRHWGQPVIVENRPGGNMTIGGRACAEAANDGYTICILPIETLAFAPFMNKKLAYDPDKDFAPITNPFFNTQVLVVSSKLNVKNLGELAAYSKAHPKTLSYTVPSVPLSLFLDKWKAETGADMVRVPFKGGGDAVNGLLSGSTPVAFFGLANWVPYIKAGSARALVVDGDKRSPLLPEVPTLREIGYKGSLTRVYFGIVAPAGTPQDIVHKLRDELARIGADPEFRQKHLIERALEPIYNTPEEFAAFLREDRATAGRIVKEAGLAPH